MKLDELQVGQNVDIIYTTYMNNDGNKRRWLRNLEVIKVLPNGVQFVQHGKTDKTFILNNDDIKAIYRNK